MVQYRTLRHGTVLYNKTIILYGMVQYNTLTYNTVRYGTIILYGMVQYCTLRYNTVLYGTIQCTTITQNIREFYHKSFGNIKWSSSIKIIMMCMLKSEILYLLVENI